MNIVKSGSTFLELEWDEQYAGAIYTIELSSKHGIILSETNTTELSFLVTDLAAGTDYTVKLYTEPEQVVVYDTILIQHTATKDSMYFGLLEVEVFDGDGNYMTQDQFTFSQSLNYGSYFGELAMNGEHSSWRDGSVASGVNPWWKATLKSPSQISSVVIHTNPSSKDRDNTGGSTISLTGPTTSKSQFLQSVDTQTLSF